MVKGARFESIEVLYSLFFTVCEIGHVLFGSISIYAINPVSPAIANNQELLLGIISKNMIFKGRGTQSRNEIHNVITESERSFEKSECF